MWPAQAPLPTVPPSLLLLVSKDSSLRGQRAGGSGPSDAGELSCLSLTPTAPGGVAHGYLHESCHVAHLAHLAHVWAPPEYPPSKRHLSAFLRRCTFDMEQVTQTPRDLCPTRSFL